ncbi:carotenoid oxygenase family protein [Streptomyces griseofuscus]|uniref:carotenoid oxygenase family protein n=1 Tax=Streptomyces griseofuscus TaxID=146922 RepID=UPI0033D0092F
MAVLDLPVTLTAGTRDAQAGLPVSDFPFAWEQQHPARLGVMPHLGNADQIQWVEVPRCYVFHVLNTYDNAEGSRTLDVIRYDEVFIRHLHGPSGRVPTLVRWVVNPATGGVDERVIRDYSVEFARIDERVLRPRARAAQPRSNRPRYGHRFEACEDRGSRTHGSAHCGRSGPCTWQAL